MLGSNIAAVTLSIYTEPSMTDLHPHVQGVAQKMVPGLKSFKFMSKANANWRMQTDGGYKERERLRDGERLIMLLRTTPNIPISGYVI